MNKLDYDLRLLIALIVSLHVGVCRVGHRNAYDVRVIDNGPVGVKHTGFVCTKCDSNQSKHASDDSQIIWGIRWSDAVDNGVNLCTPCYMNDCHDTKHQFWRIDAPADTSGKLQM